MRYKERNVPQKNKHISFSSVTTVLDEMQNIMLIREIRLAERNTNTLH